MLESEIKIIPLIDTLQLLQIDDKDYFKINYISNSKLKLINPLEEGSPEKFKIGNIFEFNSSFNVGTPIHQMVLQKETYYINEEIDKPSGKLNNLIDEIIYNRKKGFSIKDSIINSSNKVDYYKGTMSPKKIKTVLEKCYLFYLYIKKYKNKESKIPIYLDNTNKNKITSCIDNIYKNSKIMKTLFPEDSEVFNEFTVKIDFLLKFPNNKEVVLHFKGKLDNFVLLHDINQIYVNDLKSTGKYITDFHYSFDKYHYFRQIGIYSYLVNLLAKHKYNMNNYKVYSNMVLVSTIPLYDTGIFTVNDLDIKRGLDEFKHLMKRVAFHEVFGYDREFLKI